VKVGSSFVVLIDLCSTSFEFHRLMVIETAVVVNFGILSTVEFISVQPF
jgi:hypothetical protein